jgi:regulatory protein
VSAYSAALTLLSRRELSSRQVRERLQRRGYAADEVDAAVERLTSDGTLDDRRAARAYARTAATVKRHGRRRVLQYLQQIGIASDIAQEAVDEVFRECGDAPLLDAALQRRLRGRAPEHLDAHERARVARHLVSRGFDASLVFAALRRRGLPVDSEP